MAKPGRKDQTLLNPKRPRLRRPLPNPCPLVPTGQVGAVETCSCGGHIWIIDGAPLCEDCGISKKLKNMEENKNDQD